ncbi:DUF1848 domain-containing protein [Laspinema olomoucense]|uniref:DUF1848 domain-containing protein n=1 Tax=Laspinema olomoucense TaxID=3231600 RepID=UPI0021BB5A18|nr:DUF1848 domain-containing protein [Laspinema sp. D3c]MCT7994418.1 DUF1848 domain-containing protein [Laspinema sp. D3c]
MKIISASRRTDIPGFYSKWFLNRIQAGFCHWLNPISSKVYRVSLLPEDCLAIAFWTRNPKPLLPHLDFLEQQGYYFYFHFTIIGYPKAIESHNPPIEVSIETFQKLSRRLSPERVQWRYDPIVLSDVTPASYHLERFDLLTRQLEGYTRRCYFSFVDFYGKTERNLGKVSQTHGIKFQRPSLEEKSRLLQQLHDIAEPRGIKLYSCCEDALLGMGVEKAHCIDMDIIKMLRSDSDLGLKAAPTRQDCGCVEAVDIGAYETCMFGCTYCYATNRRDTALKRSQDHDPEDTVLWRPQTLRGVDLATKEGGKKQKKPVTPSPVFIQPTLFD